MTSGGPTRAKTRPLRKGRWICFFCLVAFLGTSGVPRAEQIVIDSDEQIRFALEAMEEGDYLRAITELRRFIKFFPNHAKAPRAHHLIGVNHLLREDFDSARRMFQEVIRKYPHKAISGEALLLIGESYYRQGMQEEAAARFEEVVRRYPESELTHAALYRLGWSRIQEDRWREASDVFLEVPKSSGLYTNARNLSEMSLKGLELPRKDPAVAGVASAFMPGLGHAYCGRPRDGLVAFLLNGLFLWATVESFEEDHEALGTIFGLVEAGWYSGVIYSAVNAAHKHNRKVRNDYRRSLPDKFGLDLFATGEGHIGLAFKVTF